MRVGPYLGDRDHPYNVFDFSPSRERKWPQEFLGDWSGYLHADAFAGFDGLYVPQRSSPIWEVGCWAHARRKFY